MPWFQVQVQGCSISIPAASDCSTQTPRKVTHAIYSFSKSLDRTQHTSDIRESIFIASVLHIRFFLRNGKFTKGTCCCLRWRSVADSRFPVCEWSWREIDEWTSHCDTLIDNYSSCFQFLDDKVFIQTPLLDICKLLNWPNWRDRQLDRDFFLCLHNPIHLNKEEMPGFSTILTFWDENLYVKSFRSRPCQPSDHRNWFYQTSARCFTGFPILKKGGPRRVGPSKRLLPPYIPFAVKWWRMAAASVLTPWHQWRRTTINMTWTVVEILYWCMRVLKKFWGFREMSYCV